MRRTRNERLSNAIRWWAFNTLHTSEGADSFYRQRRAAGEAHEAALRRLANKLLGQLHHCLEHHELYREDIAWPNRPPDIAA
jgi:hypothetical protein